MKRSNKDQNKKVREEGVFDAISRNKISLRQSEKAHYFSIDFFLIYSFRKSINMQNST